MGPMLRGAMEADQQRPEVKRSREEKKSGIFKIEVRAQRQSAPVLKVNNREKRKNLVLKRRGKTRTIFTIHPWEQREAR